ncbi:DNA cytosine methyltransferase [Prescottella agglutinans]|uniref:DNA (cytosine-5-)-methyltransferase n=1 Tax=Prescottella agglutinans TaxID=1644129 RepID=A0A3S3AED6_9NOCA|nr:DNA cytosine methyltransferase [Prescottella agglutinans]RVW08219.1 DNA cytosine methyltransferase [Prescottella agglutinans]
MTPALPRSVDAARPEIVDLFAGPGGLDVAAHWLGVPATGIEWDANARATREAAGLRTVFGDVRDYGPSEFPNATILAGGPPCQTYTVAGSGSGRRALEQVLAFVKRMGNREDVRADVAQLEDERTGLVLEPLRWALEAHECERPYEAIVLEQVPAVLPVWEAVGEVLASIGYKVDFGILRTEEFGVPQTRRRAVLIARREEPARLPGATHRRYRKDVPREDGHRGLLPWTTLGEALQRQSWETVDRPSRPEPFVVISNYGSGGDPKARGRRWSHQPAATVTGKVSRNRVVTPEDVELERFTHREAGRLQTFPLDYPWSGNDLAQQIGNAIPPRLGAHVLAAALGNPLDTHKIDRAVRGQWSSPVD